MHLRLPRIRRNRRPAAPITPQPASRRTRATSIVIAALLGAATAVISYSHGLDVVRSVGTTGYVAALTPLCPDGLIAISSAALYYAAQSGTDRPLWAVGGLWGGIAVTVTINVCAGLPDGRKAALIAAMAPVVLVVSLEILIWILRNAPRQPRPQRCPHPLPGSVAEAIATGFLHQRDCLGQQVTYAEHGTRWGVDRRRVAELVQAAAQSPNGAGPMPGGGTP